MGLYSMDETNTNPAPVIQKDVIDAILEKGVDFNVVITHPTVIERIGIRLGIVTKKRTFYIHPLCLGTLLKVAKLVLDIDGSVLETAGDDLHNVGIESIVNHKDAMVMIVALAIINEDRNPPDRLIRFLNRNLTVRDLMRLLILVIRQMEVKDFLACMVSAKNMNLLEAARKRNGKSRPEDITISGKPSAASSSTIGSDGGKSSGR